MWRIGRGYSAFTLFLLAMIVYPTLWAIQVTGNYSVITVVQEHLLVLAEFLVAFCFTLGVMLHFMTLKLYGRQAYLTGNFELIYPGKFSVFMVLIISIASFMVYLNELRQHQMNLLAIMIERGIESSLNISFYPRWMAGWFEQVGILLFAYKCASGKKYSYTFVAALIILTTAWLIIQGGRKALLDYFLYLWLIWGVTSGNGSSTVMSFFRIHFDVFTKKRAYVSILSILLATIFIAALTYARTAGDDGSGAERGFEMLVNGSYGGLDTTGFILTNKSGQSDVMLSVFDWIWAPIPRSMWPDKPLMLGGRIVEEMGFDLQTYGAPTVNFYGELFRMGGLLALMVGITIMGMFTSYIETRIKSEKRLYSVLMFLAIYVFGINNLWILSFSDAVNFIIMFSIPLVMIRFLSKKKYNMEHCTEPAL